jgi:hypothetical protein
VDAYDNLERGVTLPLPEPVRWTQVGGRTVDNETNHVVYMKAVQTMDVQEFCRIISAI